eukprot:TRINITY_DN8606_c0_g1_i7.p1 TRINITY_DN8606_c0_g1~~TRINITY_DN8606_c0_g1_i7.p1  ORF type:complete len:456 (-),score=121.91 TRINITY_DN8606_c0_g1_i7:34-1332(-)
MCIRDRVSTQSTWGIQFWLSVGRYEILRRMQFERQRLDGVLEVLTHWNHLEESEERKIDLLKGVTTDLISACKKLETDELQNGLTESEELRRYYESLYLRALDEVTRLEGEVEDLKKAGKESARPTVSASREDALSGHPASEYGFSSPMTYIFPKRRSKDSPLELEIEELDDETRERLAQIQQENKALRQEKAVLLNDVQDLERSVEEYRGMLEKMEIDNNRLKQEVEENNKVKTNYQVKTAHLERFIRNERNKIAFYEHKNKTLEETNRELYLKVISLNERLSLMRKHEEKLHGKIRELDERLQSNESVDAYSHLHPRKSLVGKDLRVQLTPTHGHVMIYSQDTDEFLLKAKVESPERLPKEMERSPIKEGSFSLFTGDPHEKVRQIYTQLQLPEISRPNSIPRRESIGKGIDYLSPVSYTHLTLPTIYSV